MNIYLKRFYLTLGHYPGHLICFHIKLGSLSFRGFPQFGNVAAKKKDIISLIIFFFFVIIN